MNPSNDAKARFTAMLGSRRKIHLVVGGVAAVAFALGIGWLTFYDSSTSRADVPADALAHFEILRDQEPSPETQHPLPTHVGEWSLSHAKLVAADSHAEYFIGVTSHGWMCLILAPLDTSGGATCNPVDDVIRYGMPLRWGLLNGDRFVVAVVPDGFSEDAESVDWFRVVSPNLIVVEDVDAAADSSLRRLDSVDGSSELDLQRIKALARGPLRPPRTSEED